MTSHSLSARARPSALGGTKSLPLVALDTCRSAAVTRLRTAEICVSPARRSDEPVPGYPKRPVPCNEAAAKALKKRTLTNLYNARPQWLADAHAALDAAVANAYGWPADITDDDALRKLLALNGGG